MKYPDPPKSLREFSQAFPDDAACADYLFQLRHPLGYECPKCGSTQAWAMRNKVGMMVCGNGHQVSLTAGTAMHRTKQPLHLWFHAAWLVATLKPGMSATQFQRQMGFTRLETAWAMLHKLRSGLVAPDREKLSSKCYEEDRQHTAHWVEVDETYIGGKEEGTEHRGRGSDSKALVAIAVEVHQWAGDDGKKHTKAGRCRMRVVPDAAKGSLMPFIEDNVAKGSTVHTDAHGGYNFLAAKGYKRMVTVAKFSDDPLPTIGRVTTNLKRWLMGTHKGAVHPKHLQAYLNEFTFRFNRRDIPWFAFNRALGLAVGSTKAVEYEALYKGTWVHPNPTDGPDQYGLL